MFVMNSQLSSIQLEQCCVASMRKIRWVEEYSWRAKNDAPSGVHKIYICICRYILKVAHYILLDIPF